MRFTVHISVSCHSKIVKLLQAWPVNFTIFSKQVWADLLYFRFRSIIKIVKLLQIKVWPVNFTIFFKSDFWRFLLLFSPAHSACSRGLPQQDTESLLLFCTRPVQTGLFLYSLFYVLHTQLEKAKMNQGLVQCSQYWKEQKNVVSWRFLCVSRVVRFCNTVKKKSREINAVKNRKKIVKLTQEKYCEKSRETAAEWQNQGE